MLMSIVHHLFISSLYIPLILHCDCAPVIPAIGFFCSGGRCVIVSMKQHGSSVAKVVNPLGTVVTVPLDDVADVDWKPEEVIIHENCDEAMFRPVIASKSLHYADDKQIFTEKTKAIITDNICIKNLKSTTEVTYKIANKELGVVAKNGKKQKVKEFSSKNEKNNKTPIDLELSNSFSKQCRSKCEVEKGISDNSGSKISSNVKSSVKMFVAEQPQKPDLQQPDYGIQEDYQPEIFSDNTLKNDHFEDAQELCEGFIEENTIDSKEPIKHLQNEITKLIEREHSSSEDNMIEEKTVTKKIRKPKPKLGVRIPNINKEKMDEKSKEECIENLSVSPKKTWSSIVSAKPTELIDLDGEITQSKDLIIDDVLNKSVESSKIDSTDDEKINGSQTETTESDDSAKTAQTAVDKEVFNITKELEIIKEFNNEIKSLKRKSKKKKK